MCCFTAPVEHIGNTSIFARLSGTGTQFLVYQMNYRAAQPLAMILPLPVALPSHENAVRFIDLKGYPEFFHDMDYGFYVPPPVGTADDPMAAASPAAGALEVETVGDYVASFVPTLNDFGRLDPRFVLPRHIWDQIPIYHDYGFAVFQLKASVDKDAVPHPIAFEFPTRHREKVFFPTVHIHDLKVHPTENFDHSLYMQDAGPATEKTRKTASEFMKIPATRGIVDPDTLCHRVMMNGDLPNQDVCFNHAADWRIA